MDLTRKKRLHKENKKVLSQMKVQGKQMKKRETKLESKTIKASEESKKTS